MRCLVPAAGGDGDRQLHRHPPGRRCGPRVQRCSTKYTSSGGRAATEASNRGASLLGLPAASADLAILSLGVAIAMIARGYPRRLLLGGLAVLYVLGVVAAAEFATVIGLVVAVVALMILTKSARLAAYAVPVALVGGVLLWPIISIRLEGFHSATGLPQSWVVRLINLRTYFWPVLFSGQQLDPGRAARGPHRHDPLGVRLRLDRERLHLAALGRRDPAARQLPRVRRLACCAEAGPTRGAPTRPGSPPPPWPRPCAPRSS